MDILRRSNERERDERGGDASSLVRHEEGLDVTAEWKDLGRVRARKTWKRHRVDKTVPRHIQYLEGVETVPVEGEDSGEVETLPDGSISIPVLEEQIIVTRRTVVRERIIVRKQEEVREVIVRANLGREHVEIETEGDVQVTEDGRPLEQMDRELSRRDGAE